MTKLFTSKYQSELWFFKILRRRKISKRPLGFCIQMGRVVDVSNRRDYGTRYLKSTKTMGLETRKGGSKLL